MIPAPWDRGCGQSPACLPVSDALMRFEAFLRRFGRWRECIAPHFAWGIVLAVALAYSAAFVFFYPQVITNDDEANTTPEQRADMEMADRALRAAMFGFLFLPLQIYSLWLLSRLSTRLFGDRATPAIRRRMRNAFLMDLFVIVLGLIIAVIVT